MTINLIGNIGKDAELRKVNVGGVETAVLSFWVAENNRKRDGSQETLWHKVTIWRNYAETMAQYLKSGRKVFVTGTAKADSYTKDNMVHPYISVQASEIKLLDGKKPEEEVAADEEAVEESTPWD